MSEDSSRLDRVLLEAGLARSRTHARRIVEEGRARINGKAATKPSTPVPAGARLEVIDVPDGVEYASRAAHKLAGALDALGITPSGAHCLDAGASTGGFTDVLLRRGAASVIAVDIGHDQLLTHLREDSRVQVRDGTSVRDLSPALIGTTVDLLVADLSFISLRTVIAPLASVVREGGDLLLMVKPQFEVGKAALPRSGVVSDVREHLRAVRGVWEAAQQNALELRGAGPSSLPGQDGNREFFLHLRRTVHSAPLEGSACDMIEAVVRHHRVVRVGGEDRTRHAAPVTRPASRETTAPSAPTPAQHHQLPDEAQGSPHPASQEGH